VLGALTVVLYAWTATAMPSVVPAPEPSSSDRPAPTETPQTVGNSWWAPKHPERQATTTVTLTAAAQEELTRHPDYEFAQVAPDVDFVKITIVHDVRVKSTDPVLAELRSGAAAGAVTDFTRAGLGTITTDGGSSLLAPSFLPPDVRVGPDGDVSVRLRGTGFGQVAKRASGRFPDSILGVSFSPAQQDLVLDPPKGDRPPVRSHAIHVTAPDWVSAGVAGRVPIRQDTHSLDLAGGETDFRVAFVRDNQNAGLVGDAIRSYFNGVGPDAPSSGSGLSLTLNNWGALLFLILALALAVMLVRALGRSWWRRGLNRQLAAAVVACLLSFSLVYTLGGRGRPWTDVAVVILLWLVLPAVAVRHAVKRVGRPPWTPRDMAVNALVLLLVAAVLFWTLPRLGGGTRVVAFAGACLLPLGVLVHRSGRRLLLPVMAASVVGLLAVTQARLAAAGVAPPRGVIVLEYAGVAALVLMAGIAVAGGRWPPERIILGVTLAVTAVLLVEPGYGDSTTLIDGWDGLGEPGDYLDVPWSTVSGYLILMITVLLVMRLRRLGRMPEAVALPEARATAIVVLMALFLAPRDGNLSLASLCVPPAVALLMSRKVTEHVLPLAAITLEQHRSLVRGAIRRRLLRRVEDDLLRTARGRLATGELTLDSFDRQAADLHEAINETSHGTGSRLALATSGGRSPWANGLVTFVVAVVVTLPMARLQGPPMDGNLYSFLVGLRTILGLPFLGFVFGYFYPRVRGHSPIGKSIHLLAVALIVELAMYAVDLTGSQLVPRDKVNLLAIVCGQAVFFAVALGLFWEWWLMRLADEPWSRVRNVRSLRALGAPLLAVLIAGGTAAATVVAGNAVTELLKPPPASVVQPTSDPLIP
jgi:hypothetical protein